MAEPEYQEKKDLPVTPAAEETQPKLSVSFFQELLNPPSCKTIGVCDGCGRCER